jgi:hypothetical protein
MRVSEELAAAREGVNRQYGLPANVVAVGSRVHVRNVEESVRRAEAQHRAGEAELLAEQRAAGKARQQARRDKEWATERKISSGGRSGSTTSGIVLVAVEARWWPRVYSIVDC